MTRFRLRDARTAEAEQAYYARTYPDGYKHTVWPDHVERVAASVALLNRWSSRFTTAADLSCGDGAILRGLSGLNRVYVGDLNGVDMEQPGWSGSTTEVTQLPPGALPESLWALPEDALPVDLYVLSETLEHMDDPDRLLQSLTMFSRYLFVSTPVDERHDSGNLEHYWSWSCPDVHNMLMDNGWLPLERELLVPQSTVHMDDAYHYQLWLAVNRER